MSGVTTIVLKTSCSCKGCVSRMKKDVSKIEGGFHIVSVDVENNLITVKGVVNKGSFQKLKRKLKPSVEIFVSNNGGGGGGGGGGGWESVEGELDCELGRGYEIYSGGGEYVREGGSSQEYNNNGVEEYENECLSRSTDYYSLEEDSSTCSIQ